VIILDIKNLYLSHCWRVMLWRRPEKLEFKTRQWEQGKKVSSNINSNTRNAKLYKKKHWGLKNAWL